MKYAGQLKKHDPFLFAPPDGFSPWSDRLLIDLRHRLKSKGQSDESLRHVAKLLDRHLDAIARAALQNFTIRARLLGLLYPADSHILVQCASTVSELREVVCDYDLLQCEDSNTAHLSDIPAGWNDIDAFVKFTTLALGKMAAAVDARTSAKGVLVLEAMAAGNMAITLYREAMGRKLEMLHVQISSNFAASEVANAQKARTSAIKRKVATDGHDKLYGVIKKRTGEVIKGKSHRFYTDAAKYVHDTLEAEKLLKHVKPEASSFIQWIKESGWRPEKSKMDVNK